MTQKSPSQIIDELVTLQQAYAHTPRSMITEERYQGLIQSKLIQNYSYDSEFLREPLLEHVGHLPIIASFLHQYVEHSAKIDLGRSLMMLSIHDIGETQVGDILAYDKTDQHTLAENQVVRTVLPAYLLPYFDEFELRSSLDAKFAKAVDSIAPFLHELVLPDLTSKRMKYHNFDVDKIFAKKQIHFTWDSVLRAIFDELIERYKKM